MRVYHEVLWSKLNSRVIVLTPARTLQVVNYYRDGWPIVYLPFSVNLFHREQITFTNKWHKTS